MAKIDDYFRIIGGNIIRFRTGAGLSQETLSKKSGIGRSTIQSMERGEPCTVIHLIKIADALGVSPADLFLSSGDHKEITYKTKLLIEKITEVLNLK